MELENSTQLVEGQEINQNEIFFISDIEHFSSKIKNYLLDRIKNNKFKAVVFVGDVLSGFSTEDPSYKIFKQSDTAFEMFYDVKKIMKKSANKNIGEWNVAREYIGQVVSNILLKKYAEELKTFKSFVKACYKTNIPVILFSGNHDSLLSHVNLYDERFIPVLNEIHSLRGLKIPEDFEVLKLKKDLYLMGIHTDEHTLETYQFPKIKDMLERLDKNIKNPEQIIFVSHVPGIKKFTNLGSPDISNFKKRFKFKYHYHGHCEDYYGEYDEEGVPTRSVNINKDQ